jgi:multiple sugar transport system permease protein
MALFDRRTRHRLLLLSCGLLFIPTTALWLTRFSLLTWLGLGNTHLALIAPAFAGSSPFFVLLFYWAFRRVPDELYEAALLNGANVLMLWARIAIPLSLPTTIVVGALAFWHYWSDFLSPLMFLQSQALYTLPVGLQQLLQLDASNWPILMAGAAVLAGPAIVVFALLQPFLTPSSGHTPPQ